MIENTTASLCLLLALSGALATAGTARKGGAKAVPEQVTPLTQEQLNTVVPHFYCFEYRFQPQPGKRYWLRVSKKKWIERYPDGMESAFIVLGHGTVKDFPGTLVVKVKRDSGKTGADNEGGLQAFIPDKGSSQMHHWYRNTGRGDTDWHDLGPMLSVE